MSWKEGSPRPGAEDRKWSHDLEIPRNILGSGEMVAEADKEKELALP